MLVAWIAFLVAMAAIPTDPTRLTDVMTGADVSSQYAVERPFGRYLLEPLTALVYIGGAEPIGLIVLLPATYISARVVFLLVEKVALRTNGGPNRKVEIVLERARNVVNFFWKYALLGIAAGASIIGIGYLQRGFQFINDTFMGTILVIVWILVCIVSVKVAFNLATLFGSKLKFRVKPRKRWKDLPRTSARYWGHKVFDVLGREPRYMVSIALLAVVLIYFFESLPLPTHRIVASSAPDEYLFDFHTHTFYSDGSLSPEARVDWYIAQGFRGAAFTDHDTIKGWSRAKAYVQRNNLPFTVIKGQEYTRHDDIGIHLNIYNLDFAIAPETQASIGYPDTLYMNVSDMIATAKANGGYVSVNHYGGYPGWPYTFEQLRDWGVFGFEILYIDEYFQPSTRDFCIANNLACLAGSDEHMNGELKSFVQIQLDDPSNVTEIFTKLRLNAHKVIWIEPQDEVFPTYNDWYASPRKYLNAFAAFGNYFAGLDGGQLASWIAWSCSAYILLAAIATWVKKTPLDTMEAKIVVDPRKRCLLLKLSPSYRKLMRDFKANKK